MNRQQKKAEKFINAFCSGLDDPVMEQILRVIHLGESEDKLNELIERQRNEMEEYISKFELTDGASAILTEEEKEQAISTHNTNANDDAGSSPDKGHDNIPSEHSADDGISS